MNPQHPNETHSCWLENIEVPRFDSLNENLEVDVCIVGAGIGGLTTAYLCQQEGLKVCIVEDYEIASGQSGRTTAQFATALDDRYYEIQRMHGKKGAKLAAESHRAAISKVEKIIRAENINCEFEYVNGYLFDGKNSDLSNLKKEYEACLEAGMDEVEWIDDSPLPDWDHGPCLKFARQMQLHPGKYLSHLARLIVSRGGKIFSHTRAEKMVGGENAYVETRGGFRIDCSSIVVATNTPVNDVFAIHTKQAPYRTYVVAFSVPKGSVPKGLFWDTLDPYHYVRIEADPTSDVSEILIVGGEDHKTGQEPYPEKRFAKLEEWTKEHFVSAQDVLYRWSGQVMEPVDGMAYLGHNPLDRKNVYIITGDSGNGMTHATIGAMLITDQILNRLNPWEQLYNPSRVTLRSLSEFIKENANVAVQYTDWLSPKGREDLLNLPVGEGMVIRQGLHLLAAYKEHSGNFSFMSAACPHLQGVVVWNRVEKSWDCPCHGSRFDCQGRVIEGPANCDLKRFESSLPKEVDSTL